MNTQTAPTLRNGAIVLKQFYSPTTCRMTVLAEWHGEHKFVTWRVDGDGNAYLGHYFKTYAEALADYFERA